jgi:hypothetical protein
LSYTRIASNSAPKNFHRPFARCYRREHLRRDAAGEQVGRYSRALLAIKIVGEAVDALVARGYSRPLLPDLELLSIHPPLARICGSAPRTRRPGDARTGARNIARFHEL